MSEKVVVNDSRSAVLNSDGTVTRGSDPRGGALVTGSQGGSVAGATEIKVAGSVSDLGAGVAGQGLVLQRIGPFAITEATPDLFGSPGILLAELAEGSMVMQGITLMRVTSADAVGLEYDVFLPDHSNYVAVQADNLGTSGGADISAVPDLLNGVTPSTWFSRGVQPVLVGSLGAELRILLLTDPSGETFSADIYAIIATPAS